VTSAIWRQLKQLRITLSAGLIVSFVSIIALPFGDLSPEDDLLDIVLELTLGIIATSVFWLVLLPGLWLSGKISGKGWWRPAALFASIVISGIARGSCIYLLSETFNFDSAAGLGQRLANSLSTMLLWLLVFSLFSNAAKSFSQNYQDLFRQLAFQRASRLSGSEVEKIFSGLESGIRQISELAIDESKAGEEFKRIADALERDIIEKIKSHSKALWNFSHSSVPKLKAFALFRLAVARLDYSLSFVIALFGMLTLLNISSTVGFEEAVWRVALALGLLAALDLAYRRVIRPLLRVKAPANLGFLIISAIAVQFPLGLASYFLEQSSAPIAFIVVLAISAPLLMVLLSVLNLADLARRDLLEELRVFDELLRDQGLASSSATSELASYLHNSLQSEIQSIILALKNESSEVSVGKSSLERLRLLSNRSLDEEFTKFTSLPRDHLELVVQGWAGILDIALDWETAPELSDDPRVPTIVQIIEEVASNSAVHGRATRMSAKVRSEGPDFTVEVSNNTSDLTAMAESGQGSLWLAGFVDPIAPSQVTGEYRRTFRV